MLKPGTEVVSKTNGTNIGHMTKGKTYKVEAVVSGGIHVRGDKAELVFLKFSEFDEKK